MIIGIKYTVILMVRGSKRRNRQRKRGMRIAALKGFKPTVDVNNEWEMGKIILPITEVPRNLRYP